MVRQFEGVGGFFLGARTSWVPRNSFFVGGGGAV